MTTDHDELKLKKRPEGFRVFFVRRLAPHIQFPGERLKAGRHITLRSAADESVGINAKILSYNGRRLTATILGFERWAEENHNGIACGDTIWCDDTYVITCQCD